VQLGSAELDPDLAAGEPDRYRVAVHPDRDELDAVWLCEVGTPDDPAQFRPPIPDPGLAGSDPVPVGHRRRPHKREAVVVKLLEDAQVKLSVVASDIFGVSGRATMAALIAGQRDPKGLAQMAPCSPSRVTGAVPPATNTIAGGLGRISVASGGVFPLNGLSSSVQAYTTGGP
jgi:hypothetical protein